MPDGTEATGIGASVRRKEDYRFLTGQGNYTDDINRPKQTYAYILRSREAHAKITVKTDTAKQATGVVAIFTGDDMQVGSIPCGWQVDSKDGTPMREPEHPPLAKGVVRYVGDQIAVVIAESLNAAKDAAELIDVQYSPLPVAVDLMAAVKSGNKNGALVHPDLGTNICYDWEIGDEAEIDAALAKSFYVTELEIRNNRLIPNAMEPRVAIGDYDKATDHYTLYTTSQNPHVIRLLMGAFVLSIPEHKLRVIAPDVGGGFGSKKFHYAEEAIVTWASHKIRRPVKWTSDRS